MQGQHKEGNNKCLSHDPSIPLLLVYPQEVKTYVQNIKMFISIFIHNIQVCKQEKWSLSGELITLTNCRILIQWNIIQQ